MVLPSMVGVLPSMVGVAASMVGVVPSMAGVVPSMVGVAPSMVGVVPSMAGVVPSHTVEHSYALGCRIWLSGCAPVLRRHTRPVLPFGGRSALGPATR